MSVCVCVCESVLQLHSLNSLGRAVALRLCTSVWPFLLLSLCVTVLFILWKPAGLSPRGASWWGRAAGQLPAAGSWCSGAAAGNRLKCFHCRAYIFPVVIYGLCSLSLPHSAIVSLHPQSDRCSWPHGKTFLTTTRPSFRSKTAISTQVMEDETRTHHLKDATLCCHVMQLPRVGK